MILSVDKPRAIITPDKGNDDGGSSGEFLLEDDKQPLLEMSVKKAKAEQIISGLEQPINLHLLKLMGMQADAALRRYWKNEINTWLFRIASLTLKPDKKPIPAKFVFEWLYNETYGDDEIANVESTLDYLGTAYRRNSVDTRTIAAAFKALHAELAARIARNNRGQDIIAAL